MRTIAGRLLRELLRLLPDQNAYRERIDTCMRFVNGERLDGHKIYSLHEPDVVCVSKGKEGKKYEFGSKISIVRLWDGLIIGALSFRNETYSSFCRLKSVIPFDIYSCFAHSR
ncbi:hypothetical protein HMPREF0645_1578 [Hallella bergensis DSM 17361]|uniref:Uncharacterized protein n=2 Tax=Hallella bergensis TaxID=242750 RepID=D1PX93_9BACT|nr:hypothetical protein HMPREF0645_1578 [Hallella bergensis DSM 17361]